ncbi:hypothetical protein NECID01_0940 [Nematocida sp. AWRm77]|nr:hypothetical protein NECID01_0940 [Nematocida sp. AWRm77]
MKTKVRIANSIAGGCVSIYGNLDYGKPARLRSLSIKEYVFRFYHLTHIGLLLTTATFFCALVLWSMEKKTSRWSSLHSFYIPLLALTSTAECFIPLSFWVLWCMNKDNVVNSHDYVGEDSISFFFNLCMHGLPSVFLLVEFFLSEFRHHKGHYFLLFSFFVLYMGIMGLFYRNTGLWPYRIISKLGVVWRILFFAHCFLILCVIYTALSATHRRLYQRYQPDRKKSEECPTQRKKTTKTKKSVSRV